MSQISGPLSLTQLDQSQPHSFEIPQKLINDGDQDLPFFLTSKAYHDITLFLMQLNISMFPRQSNDSSSPSSSFTLDDAHSFSEPVQALANLLEKLDRLIDEVPPDPGPRRFGNISFRRWCEKVEARAEELLEGALPDRIFRFKPSSSVRLIDEMKPYFLGSLGSSQRLDYGSGHELSFLALLASVWKLGGFNPTDDQLSEREPGVLERSIVIGIMQPYFKLIRRLIKTYTLEPAGSHGVWGLDDHSFLPYIFGSAQLSPPIPALASQAGRDALPTEGSLAGAPSPADITDKAKVEQLRKSYMYFSAIGFIYDVKTGPFWEHSPVLYDISGVPGGWAKINKGMLKMYNAEVLGKFPVVQHFPFGSLFRWERDPDARSVPLSTHSKAHGQGANRVQQNASTAHPATARPSGRGSRLPGTMMPGRSVMTSQAPASVGSMPVTQAPWAVSARPGGMQPPTRAPWAAPSVGNGNNTPESSTSRNDAKPG